MVTPSALAARVLDDVYAHAREGYPEEVCGLDRRASDEARRCENRQNALHAEDPETFPRDARTAYNLGAGRATSVYSIACSRSRLRRSGRRLRG